MHCDACLMGSTRAPLFRLGLFSAALLFIAWSPGGTEEGEVLYRTHCLRCHGEDGGRRKWGAADLRASVMPDSLILRRIGKGKGIMPSFSKKLTEEQRDQVMRYVKTLRRAKGWTELP